MRNGYNEHLGEGEGAFRRHWRLGWDRGVFTHCPSIWHCLTFSFRDGGPAGLQVRLEAGSEQEMEVCACQPSHQPLALCKAL